MARSKKLLHQLSRYLGSDKVEQDLSSLISLLRGSREEPIPLPLIDMLERVPAFLDVVDFSYQKYEENLTLAERNISISLEELVQANRSIQSMVNSLGQGFLMFDETGLCSSVYSKACETLLETIPTHKHITTILKMNDKQRAEFDTLLKLVFNGRHAMDFDEIICFAPSVYKHSTGGHVQLDYKPDIAPNGKVDRIIVVATDISEQVRAQELADERNNLFETIERISHDRESFLMYIRRAMECITMMVDAGKTIPWQVFAREIHTLKGGGGMFHLHGLVDAFHALETALSPWTNPQGKEPPPRVEADRLLREHQGLLQQQTDALVRNLQNLLGIDIQQYKIEGSFDRKKVYAFADFLETLKLPDVRAAYIKNVCAESLRDYLTHYDLVLSGLASLLNKKIKPLVFVGGDIPIVIDPYRDLFQSFVHLFRNMLDHGIEMPEDRQEKNKDEAGIITIAFNLIATPQKQQFLHLTISDDGAGVDIVKLRTKLSEQEPNAHWVERDEPEVLASLLSHTISTRDSVSLYSGRGIGMSAVVAEVQKLGGKMWIETEKNKGTRYQIDIPYNLSWKEPNSPKATSLPW